MANSSSDFSLLPATLYEVIAYFGSGALVLVLFSIGYADRAALKTIAGFLESTKAPEKILLFIFLGVLTYGYGQLSSTFSGILVGAPVSRIVKRLGARASADFRMDLTPIVEAYGLHRGLPPQKVNNKWTLLFYLQVVNPDIGRDLLKRYAREKLARINSLNMLVLTVIGIIGVLFRMIGIGSWIPLQDSLQWPSGWFVVFCLILTVLFSFEFYKRKCWNRDLLVKVMAGVHKAEMDVGRIQRY